MQPPFGLDPSGPHASETRRMAQRNGLDRPRFKVLRRSARGLQQSAVPPGMIARRGSPPRNPRARHRRDLRHRRGDRRAAARRRRRGRLHRPRRDERGREVAARTGASFVEADVRDARRRRASRCRRPSRRSAGSTPLVAQRGRSPRSVAVRDDRRGLGRGPRDEPHRPVPLRGRLPARAPRAAGGGSITTDLVGRRRLGRDVDRRLLGLEARAEHARPDARSRGRAGRNSRQRRLPGRHGSRAWPRTSQVAPSGRCRPAGRCHPLGRVGTARDVAAAVAFFASPDAAFCNGSLLLVDGGMRASLHASAVAVRTPARRMTAPYGLEGRVALVTGGTSGIGRGCVERLREEGMRSRSPGEAEERGEAVAGETGADFVAVRPPGPRGVRPRPSSRRSSSATAGSTSLVANAGILFQGSDRGDAGGRLPRAARGQPDGALPRSRAPASGPCATAAAAR